jgi:hypothetical protein
MSIEETIRMVVREELERFKGELGEQRTPAQPDLPEEISTREAGRVLGVSSETVRKYANGGKLKGRWRGKRLFIERASVEAMRVAQAAPAKTNVVDINEKARHIVRNLGRG